MKLVSPCSNGPLLIACGHPPKLLEAVDYSLHQIALVVSRLVEVLPSPFLPLASDHYHDGSPTHLAPNLYLTATTFVTNYAGSSDGAMVL
jgi:hypothetical protein